MHQAALAFHGFSRPLEDMLAARPLLAENTALVMPHLAAHGRSSGHHRPLSPDDWFQALDGILAQEGLAFGGTLIGYSLGGRLALNWWSHQPHRFTRVLLIAPDGLVKNPGYWFSVETLLGQIADPARPPQKTEIAGPLILRDSARIPEGWER